LSLDVSDVTAKHQLMEMTTVWTLLADERERQKRPGTAARQILEESAPG